MADAEPSRKALIESEYSEKMTMAEAEPSRKALIESEDSEMMTMCNYTSEAWSSSSDESEFEGFCVPKHLVASNLSPDITEADIHEFFKGTGHVDRICRVDPHDIQSLIVFESVPATKEALKLRGEKLLGRLVEIKPYATDRVMLCLTGFDPQLSECELKENIITRYASCGKVLKIFVPTERLGLAYIYLDQTHIKKAMQKLSALPSRMGKDVIQHYHVKLKLEVCRGKMQIDEREPLSFEKLIDGDERAYLKKENRLYMDNLDKFLETYWHPLFIVGHTEMIFSWRTLREDIIPCTETQFIHNCWAISFCRGYNSSVRLNDSPRELLTAVMIMEGVGERPQMTGRGIDRLSSAIPFMKSRCEDFIIHQRPRGDEYKDYEAFEDFIISLLEKGPISVSIDMPPSLLGFRSKCVFHPTAFDLVRMAHEKLERHNLFLTGHGVEVSHQLRRGFWDLQDSQGQRHGDGGFIKLARHQCLIRQVIEIKV